MLFEVLPYLDFDIIADTDKEFWGYSDLTTIINAIYTKTQKSSVLYQIRNLIYQDSLKLLKEFEQDPIKIWDSNIFGKSLHDLVREGLAGKLMRMPEDAQNKTRETLSRIINEGSGGMICIML